MVLCICGTEDLVIPPGVVVAELVADISTCIGVGGSCLIHEVPELLRAHDVKLVDIV